MNYFKIKQDRSIQNYPELNFSQFPIKRKDIVLENANKISDVLPVNLINLKNKLEWTDLLDTQIILFSDSLMSKFRILENEIIIKDVPLIHIKTLEIHLYKLPIFRFIPCVQDKKQSNTLLLRNKIPSTLHIFRTENMQKDSIILKETILEKVDFTNFRGVLIEPITIYFSEEGTK